MPVNIRQSDKVAILGDYQTGKTTFAKWLLSQSPRYLVFDPTAAFPGGVATVREAEQQFNETGRSVLYAIDSPETVFNDWAQVALRAKNAVAFVDEPALVMTSGGAIPPNFSKLLRLGHKRGVGLHYATHRFHGDLPAISRIVRHMFIFRMAVDIDLDALRGYIGPEGVAYVKEAPNYHFWYRGPDETGRLQQGPHEPIPLSGGATGTGFKSEGGGSQA